MLKLMFGSPFTVRPEPESVAEVVPAFNVIASFVAVMEFLSPVMLNVRFGAASICDDVLAIVELMAPTNN